MIIVGKGEFLGFSLSAGYSGVGLLTKIDPIDVRFGIDDEKHDAEGRVITAEFDKFYLVCSYIPNSGQKLVRLNYRQEFDVDFHRYLKSLQAKKPTIWFEEKTNKKKIRKTKPFVFKVWRFERRSRTHRFVEQ